MKAPSKNISSSLRGQSVPGRGPEAVSVSRDRQYAPSMTVPGEGGTSKAPGSGTSGDGRQERNATVYADAVGRKLGG